MQDVQPIRYLDISLMQSSIQHTNSKRVVQCVVVSTIVATISIAIFKIIEHIKFSNNSQIQNVFCPQGFKDGEMYDFSYYQKAATDGDVEAQYCFGLMHLNGENGANQVTSTAMHWLKKAAQQGLSIARESLCDPTNYDFSLDPLEISELKEFCCPSCSECICPWDIPSRFRQL